MLVEVEKVYNEALEILEEYKVRLKEYIKILEKLADEEVNLKSTKAKVALKYDSTSMSKTALKEAVAGHPEVLDIELRIVKLKTEKEKRKMILEYLEMHYTLRKKKMSAMIEEERAIKD